MTVGARLKKRLEELGMKQNQLAALLNISPSTLNGYFTDYRVPDLKTLTRLAEALDTDVAYLITGSPSLVSDNVAEYVADDPLDQQRKTLYEKIAGASPEDLDKIIKMVDIITGADTPAKE